VVVITGAGLDANKVASLLVNAVRSNRALAPNTVAQARLNMQVAEAAQGRSLHYASLHLHAHRHAYRMAFAAR
jgi:hypothetical protein